MLPSLLWFAVYSIPPLAGWWLCFRAPLARRKFRCSKAMPADADAVWRALDPTRGGFAFLYETRNLRAASGDPLLLRLERRPRHSHAEFTEAEERCEIDATARRIVREEIGGDGARSEVTLSALRDRTEISLDYERPTTGLLAYELIRLGLARDMAALEDAVLGRDAKAAPLFRCSGWRLALLGVVSGVIMVLLVLAPAFAVTLTTLGVSAEALLADPQALGFVAAMALGIAVYLAALLIAATLVHEFGHALAMAAFGHRGVTVSLIPFGGGVALGARGYASAFEAGMVSVAGPAFSALVAFALTPDPAKLSQLLQGVAGPDRQIGATFLAFSGAVFALLTILINIPNILPWTGSDGALALGAIFRCARTRRIAAGALVALLAFVFAGIDDLLPFGLMFLALSWFNRKGREMRLPSAEGWRPLAAAGALALVVGLYAQEASTLREVQWSPAGAAQPGEKL